MSPKIFLLDLAKKYFTAGIVCLTISDRYASFTAVRGSSMSPTFNPHTDSTTGISFDDYVLVEKFCLIKYKFTRGDVVVFRSPSNYKEKNIKRIVGLPGDWIDLPSLDTVRVPEGHCWVVGDNSACSLDSRSFGLIPLGLICGRVTHTVWPPHRIGGVNSRTQALPVHAEE
ncbi:mitochondrial inner membrane protease subunit 2 [Salvia hispanica]|uniref:mitochondrial inner membrane protease subunit 2 n=1 Tax=Salvia hispanica TaxID=49212 RepID=UPI002009AF49|nr:mitochondrial inner membrane protease subunit 2 [Salvia hispanica]XP_047971484.1 mitochondrial inner membrane protease subunit 2 [Salvia hispanica]XP_047971485.1 mitochondrial inner membrane protease subunit 2 [Salvia hispanica]